MAVNSKKKSPSRKPEPSKKAAGKTSSKKTAARGSRSRSSRNEVQPLKPILPNGISPERKIDILGVAIALVGLLTLFSLFTNTPDGLSGSWVGTLRSVFGWGRFILPVGLMVLGIWLVARNVDKLPQLSMERITGFVLLFFNLLVIFQGLSGAKTGSGGGYIGKSLLKFLQDPLGGPGAFIIIIAWLLIALTMSLDISIQELFQWAGPLVARLRDRKSVV